MSRIIVTVLLAVLVLSVAFGAFGFMSISDGFIGAVQEIPFIGLFVDIIGKFLGIKTNSFIAPIDPLKDFINLLILTIAKVIIDKVVDWITSAFEGKKPIDNLITNFNKVAWKFVLTMIALMIASMFTNNLFIFLSGKIGSVFTYIIGFVLSGGLMTAIIVMSVILLGNSLTGVLIEVLLFPLLKTLAVLLLYATLVLVMSSGLNVVVGTLLIVLIAICFMIEAVTHVFTKSNK